MIKFYVLVFMFSNTPDFRMVTQIEVPTLEMCAEKTLEINVSDETPFNAACFVQKYYKDS